MIWGAIILSRIRLEKVTNQGMVRSQGCPVRCWRGNALDLVTRRLQEFHGQVVQVYVSWVVLYVLVAKILNIWKSEFIFYRSFHAGPISGRFVAAWLLEGRETRLGLGYCHGKSFFLGIGNSIGKLQNFKCFPMVQWNRSSWWLLKRSLEISTGTKLLFTSVYPVHVTVTFSRPPAEHRGPASCSTLIPACPCDCRARTPVVLAHGSNDEVWPALLGPWSDDQHQKPHRCSLTKHITSKHTKKYMYMIWIYISSYYIQ